MVTIRLEIWNGKILLLTNPGPPGKWLLKWREISYPYIIVKILQFQFDAYHTVQPVTQANSAVPFLYEYVSSALPSSLHSRPAHLGYILLTNSAQWRTVAAAVTVSLLVASY